MTLISCDAFQNSSMSGGHSLCWLNFNPSESEDDESDAGGNAHIFTEYEEEWDDLRLFALYSDEDNDLPAHEYPEWHDSDDSRPISAVNFPCCWDTIPRLQLIAATQYRGTTELLPPALAEFVEDIRRVKTLIFGTRKYEDGGSDYHALFHLLSYQLEKRRESGSEEDPDRIATFLYSYRVSLNGVCCGSVRGPAQITRGFVRCIYDAFAIYSSLRVHNLRRKWSNLGFSVYRFTPIPHVTVLRIFLRDSETHRRVLIHVTRLPY